MWNESDKLHPNSNVNSNHDWQDFGRKSKRTARILHLKNQNTIGAAIVKGFMDSSASFKCGAPWEDPDVTMAVEKDM